MRLFKSEIAPCAAFYESRPNLSQIRRFCATMKACKHAKPIRRARRFVQIEFYEKLRHRKRKLFAAPLEFLVVNSLLTLFPARWSV